MTTGDKSHCSNQIPPPPRVTSVVEGFRGQAHQKTKNGLGATQTNLDCNSEACSLPSMADRQLQASYQQKNAQIT